MEYVGNKKKQGSIVEALQQEILSGSIPGGTEMTQNELAQALGVSRMPVREALMVLEYQGLVERLPNNHVRTAVFEPGGFAKIFDLCARIEAEELILEQKTGDGVGEFCSELEFHRSLCVRISHSYFKKTLETLLETYVSFALARPEYDRAAGLNRLKELSRASSEKDLRRLMEQYYRELTSVME